jgi:hypothetical protein
MFGARAASPGKFRIGGRYRQRINPPHGTVHNSAQSGRQLTTGWPPPAHKQPPVPWWHREAAVARRVATNDSRANHFPPRKRPSRARNQGGGKEVAARISAKNQHLVKTLSRKSKDGSPVPVFPNTIAVFRRATGVSQHALVPIPAHLNTRSDTLERVGAERRGSGDQAVVEGVGWMAFFRRSEGPPILIT